MRSALAVGLTVACTAAASGVAACTDLGGLSGNDALDASGPDASVRGGDGGDGGGVEPADAAAPFCQSQVDKELCVDFDDGAFGALTGRQPGQGSIDVIDKTLVVSVKAGAVDPTGIGKAFPLSNIQKISCEVDYRRLSEPTSTIDDLVIIGIMAVQPGQFGTNVLLVEQPAAGVIAATITPTDGGAPSTPSVSTPRLAKTAGQWVRIRFELSLAEQRVQVFRDGVSAGLMSVVAPSPAGVQNVVVTLGLGPRAPTNAAWTVAFDNFTCDL